MSNLDVMTKDELLAYGQSLGISPMNANMTKDEVRAAIDAYEAGQGGGNQGGNGGDGPDIGLQTTTTSTKDWLNRALTNPIPGTSNATDYMGRAVVTGNKDYMGRSLVP